MDGGLLGERQWFDLQSLALTGHVTTGGFPQRQPAEAVLDGDFESRQGTQVNEILRVRHVSCAVGERRGWSATNQRNVQVSTRSFTRLVSTLKRPQQIFRKWFEETVRDLKLSIGSDGPLSGRRPRERTDLGDFHVAAAQNDALSAQRRVHHPGKLRPSLRKVHSDHPRV